MKVLSIEQMTIYHGSPTIIDDFGIKSGTYFTEDIDIAVSYGRYVYKLCVSEEKEKAFSRDFFCEHWMNTGIIPIEEFEVIDSYK